MTNNIYLKLGLLFLISCIGNENSDVEFSETYPPVSVGNSRLPHLFAAKDGYLYLSWIEESEDWVRFLFSRSQDGTSWAEPELIAQGNDWFVNWADYPMLFANDKGDLLAFFLQKNGEDTYTYDVKITTKRKGEEWNAPFTPYSIQSHSEHGFVSVASSNEGDFYVAWLDGRNVLSDHNHDDDKASTESMSLHAAIITPSGKIVSEMELDSRVCDCCQTYSWFSEGSFYTVYRDRSEEEIRDIALLKWTTGKIERISFPQDNWLIKACPVNGPRAAYSSFNQAVAWFTGAESNPSVKFWKMDQSEPIVINNTSNLGRVDITTDGQVWWCSWINMKEDTTRFMLATVENNIKLNEIIITMLDGSRKSGFPQIEFFKGKLFAVYTEVSENVYQVKMKMIDAKDIKNL